MLDPATVHFAANVYELAYHLNGVQNFIADMRRRDEEFRKVRREVAFEAALAAGAAEHRAWLRSLLPCAGVFPSPPAAPKER